MSRESDEMGVGYALPLKELAGYRPIELLGYGATGPVYRARQMSLDREVVLCVLDPRLGRDSTYRRRFLHEARAVARVSHANLVSGLDVGEQAGLCYSAYELCPGERLSELLRDGALGTSEALGILNIVATTLLYVHEKGFVHGDVRPFNIVLSPAGVTKLDGFGLAQLEARLHGRTAPSMGRAEYLSPEQLAPDSQSVAQSDIYGVGATLFHMVAGRPPYDGADTQEVLGNVATTPAPPLRALVPDAAPELESLVTRCMERDCAHRIESAAALVREIAAVGQIGASRDAAVIAPKRSRGRRGSAIRKRRSGRRRRR